MKKLLATVILSSVAFGALAHGPVYHHHHGYYGGGGGWGWVAPAVIGGAIVYGVTRPSQPVVVQQPPVVVQQPQVIYSTQPNCSPWTETQNPDGTITRSRTCIQ